MLLALALLVTGAFGMAGPATAHPVTVDGLDAEWLQFGQTPSLEYTQTNVGRIIRNDQGQGEYAYRDVTDATVQASDARITNGFAAPEQVKQLDIKQFRVTGDANNLYFYVQFAAGNLAATTQPQVQIAIDNPATDSASNNTLVAPAVITPTNKMNWEYLVRSDFTNTSNPSYFFDGTNKQIVASLVGYTSPSSSPTNFVGDSILAFDVNAMEMRIPWNAIPGATGPIGKLRFSVAALRSGGEAVTGDPISNVVDVLSRTKATPLKAQIDSPEDTSAAIKNGLDYAAEVNFSTAAATIGEPYSPLLITEISVRPADGVIVQPQAQWFEITNVGSPTAINLGTFKAGDAADQTSNEGMYTLPYTVSLGLNQSMVVTRNKAPFKNRYPNSQFPGIAGASNNYPLVYEATITATVTPSFALLPYSGWGGNDFSLRSNETNASSGSRLSDEVVLLDASDTIIDLVQYSNNTTDIIPENLPVKVTAADTSDPTKPPALVSNTDFIRCPATRDTNNSQKDFVTVSVKTQHTPTKSDCAISDLYVGVTGPGGVVVDALNPTAVNYTVTYGNNRVDAINGTLAITLPRGMTLSTATPSDLSIGQPTPGTASDGRVLLTWPNKVPSAFGAQATVALALQLPAGTNPNPATNLQATFSPATGVTDSDLTNNTISYPITYSAQPFADVGIGITNKSVSEFFPGGKIVYGVTVTNAGPKQADGVTVEIDVPDFLTYKSNNQGYQATVTGNKVTLNLVSVAAGNPNTTSVSMDVEFTVKVSATVGQTAQATAVVKTTTTPETPTTNNNAATSVIPVQSPPDAPNVKIVKTLKTTGTIKQGDVVTYQLTVSNVGTQPVGAGLVTVEDDFPEQQLDYLSYQSAADIGELKLATLVRFSLRGGLAAGQTVTIDAVFTVKGSVANNTAVLNKVSVPRIAGESTDGDNTSDATLTVNPVVTGGTTKVYLPIVFK